MHFECFTTMEWKTFIIKKDFKKKNNYIPLLAGMRVLQFNYYKSLGMIGNFHLNFINYITHSFGMISVCFLIQFFIYHGRHFVKMGKGNKKKKCIVRVRVTNYLTVIILPNDNI